MRREQTADRTAAINKVLARATALGFYPEKFDVGKPTSVQKQARRWLAWWLRTQGLSSAETAAALGITARQAARFYMTVSLLRKLARVA